MREAKLMSRRTLLQASAALGASALVIGGAVAPGAMACADGAATEGGPGSTQYGFLVDLTKCVNCELCVEACRRENHLSDDTPDRRRISLYVNAKGENVTLSTSCMHCAEPSCLQVCPAGAITKGEAGIVAVDQERCIGCKYCYQACPYEVPRYNSVADGQVRLLPGRGSAGGRHAALRSRVQVRRAALRAA